MTPCQGADFRHFPSDTSAVGIWWGLFVFRTIRIWNTNCSCVDASNASPSLCTRPPTPPYCLGKYILHFSTQTQRDRSIFLSVILVKLSSFFLFTRLKHKHNPTHLNSVWHLRMSSAIKSQREREQVFKATAYCTKTANKKKTCKQ